VRTFSPSLPARGTKSRETASQQPLHAIPASLTVAALWRICGEGGHQRAVTRGNVRTRSAPRVCKSWRCEGRYPITCENVRVRLASASHRDPNSVSTGRPRRAAPAGNFLPDEPGGICCLRGRNRSAESADFCELPKRRKIRPFRTSPSVRRNGDLLPLTNY
jgi:hypothetical protein